MALPINYDDDDGDDYTFTVRYTALFACLSIMQTTYLNECVKKIIRNKTNINGLF